MEIKDVLRQVLYVDDTCQSIKELVEKAVKKSISLRYVNLRGVDLSYADLRYADLRGADLSHTDLKGVHLGGAILEDADLRGAKNVPYIPFACPSEGAFIGWKKVNDCIIKLEILEDSKRSSATTSKCRCDKARVLSITGLKSKKELEETIDIEYRPITYKVGEVVKAVKFDKDRWNECGHGIHFFINKEDAIKY